MLLFLLLGFLGFLGVIVVTLCFQTSRTLLVKAVRGIVRWVRAYSWWLALLFFILLSMGMVELAARDWNAALGMLCLSILTAGRRMADLSYQRESVRTPKVDNDRRNKMKGYIEKFVFICMMQVSLSFLLPCPCLACLA